MHGPINRVIVTVRTLPSRLRGEAVEHRASPGLLEETLGLGWGMLAEEPGHEVVMGAVTQPWKPVVEFHALPPEEFATFDEPGYAKIVWTLAAEPLGPNESLFRTETRVVTTDPESRERFRRYWSVFSPGILIIRYEALRMVKAEAERLARASITNGSSDGRNHRQRLTGPQAGAEQEIGGCSPDFRTTAERDVRTYSNARCTDYYRQRNRIYASPVELPVVCPGSRIAWCCAVPDEAARPAEAHLPRRPETR